MAPALPLKTWNAFVIVRPRTGYLAASDEPPRMRVIQPHGVAERFLLLDDWRCHTASLNLSMVSTGFHATLK